VLFTALLPLLVAGCGGQPSDSVVATAPETANQATATQLETPKVDCAPPGTADLTPVCTLDRTETAAGTILTLRHPDGAFHRLQVTRDGRGVIAADGAEPARVTPVGPDRVEVELGGARYRLPATVRGQAR
jgi:hypothetical protein